jgi:K+-transporting ATPase KdpF subunit
VSASLIFASAGDNVLGLVISIGIVAYLVFVLVFPERF